MATNRNGVQMSPDTLLHLDARGCEVDYLLKTKIGSNVADDVGVEVGETTGITNGKTKHFGSHRTKGSLR